MTPSPDDRVPDDRAPDDCAPDGPPPHAAANAAAYEAAFGRALRDAIGAAAPERPPPALLAAILGGGGATAGPRAAATLPGGMPARADSADQRPGDSAQPSAPPSPLTLHRSARPADTPPPRAGERRRRPTWVWWAPATAAALMLAVGVVGRRSDAPGTVASAAPEPAARVIAPPAGAGDDAAPGSPAPPVASRGVDANRLAVVSVFLQGRGLRAAPDSDRLRALDGAASLPVITGVDVAVPADLAERTVADTLVGTIASAAGGLRGPCRRGQLAQRDERPHVVYVDLASLADGTAVTRARRAARVVGAAAGPVVRIVETLAFALSADRRPPPARDFLGRRDVRRAVIEVRYPEVCG